MKKIRLLFIGILCIFICIGSVKATNTAADDYGGSNNCPNNFKIYNGDKTYGSKYCCPKYFYDALDNYTGLSADEVYIAKSSNNLYCILDNYTKYTKECTGGTVNGSKCYVQAKAAKSTSVSGKFYANGGHIGNTNADYLSSSCKKNADSSYCILYAPDSSKYARNGYTLSGWSTKENCSSTVYAPDSSWKVSISKNYYACWEPVKCRVRYDANGGKIIKGGNYKDYQTTADGATCQVNDLSSHTADKTGYTFAGWGKTKNCTEGLSEIVTEAGKERTLFACYYKEITLTTKYETENGTKTKSYSGKLSGSRNITNKYVDVPGEFTKNGYKYVFQGWKRVSGSVDLNKSTWNNIYFSSDATIEATFSKKKIKEENDQPAPPPTDEPSPTPVTPSPTPENPSPTEEYTIVKVTKPTISEMYYINYDLDGGKFIDGSTTRSEVVKLNRFIGALKANPIKEGYKFSKWVLKNGETIDFDKTPNDYKSLMENNILNLKAVWTKINSTEKYICPNDYPIFEPTSGYCYKVLKADDTTPDLEASDTSKTYNWTREIFPAGSRYCWNYFTGKCASGVTNDSTCSPYNHKIFVEKGNTYSTYEDALNAAINCKGSYQLVSGSVKTGNGKNNATYNGYTDQDWWVSGNTCQFGTACTEASESRNTEPCYKEYKAIIYDLKVADLVEEETEEENVVPISDDEINDNKEENSDGSNKTDEEVPYSVKTGDTLFIIALIIGFSALGYTAYYFINEYRKKKA